MDLEGLFHFLARTVGAEFVAVRTKQHQLGPLAVFLTSVWNASGRKIGCLRLDATNPHTRSEPLRTLSISGSARAVFGRHLERSREGLAGKALQGTLKDAGCTTADLGVACCAGTTNGPLQGRFASSALVVRSQTGIEGIPNFNLDKGCAAGNSAVHLANGCEKMNIPDGPKALNTREAGWDVARAETGADWAAFVLSQRSCSVLKLLSRVASCQAVPSRPPTWRFPCR